MITDLNAARHPLYQMQRRRIRWARSRRESVRYTLLISGLVTLLLLGLWGLSVYEDLRYNAEFSYASGIEYSIFMLTGLFAATLFVLPPLLDLFALAFTVQVVSHEQDMGRWELLGLAVPSRLLAQALHQIANLRTWRVLVVLVTARVLSLLLFLLTFTIVASWLFGESALLFLNDVASEFDGALGGWVLFSIIMSALMLAALYLIEPFLRVRMVTALGLVISSRVRSLPVALLAGLGALFLLWMLLPMLVLLPVGLLTGLFNALLEQLLGPQALDLAWFISTPLVIALAGGLQLVIYRWLERLLLRDLARRAP